MSDLRHKRKKRTDVVTLRVRLGRNGERIISGVSVIGSAQPCRDLLRVGRRLRPAVRCLLLNGFVLIVVSGNVLVFKRRHRKHRM